MAIETERVKSALIEWEVDPAKGVEGIKKLAKEVREEQKNERDLKAVRAELEKQTDTLTSSMSKLGQAMAHAGGELMSKALSALAGQMGAVVKQGLEWEDRISGNEVAINKLRDATGGLINSLDLQRARQRLMQGDFKLTESQIADVSKAAISLSRTMEIDFPEALDKVENAVIRGGKGLKQLGITTEFTGDASKKTADILRELHNRFGDVSTEAENTNERIEKLKNGFNDLVGGMGAALLQAPLLQKAFYLMGESFESVGRIVGSALGAFDGLSIKSKVALDDLITFTRAMPGLGNIADAMEKARNASQRMQAATSAAGYGGKGFTVGEAWTPSVVAPGKKGGAEKLWGAPDWGAVKLEDVLYPGGGAGLSMAPGMGGVGGLAAGAAGGMMGGWAQGFAAQQAEWLADPSKRLAETLPTEGFNSLTDAQLRSLDATMKLREQMKAAGEVMAATWTNLKEVGVGALGDLAGGMWNAADAAIQGGESFGTAMAKMLKSTLLSIATQATVKAVFETAEGFAKLAAWDIPGATAAFTSAGIYAGVAVMAGGAGLAMSAAGVGAGSGAARASSGASGGSGRYQETPQYGQKVENKRPININLYLGDPDSPSLSLLMQKQLKAQLGEAN